jgi:sn-glycerol 3-phosphate transport system ATP-binding protein
MSMADRVILLNAGHIEQNGTAADLYEAPASLFAARFIGTPAMNLLALELANGGAVIAGTTGPVVASAEHATETLGLRPEHVTLGHETGVDARVEGVEYLGADSLLTCRIGTQVLALRVAGRSGLSQGDATRLSWARGAQHFFDTTTGRRTEGESRRAGATMFA